MRLGTRSFLRAVQARSARVAVGASAIRGQGKGVAAVARVYFADLPLRQFATVSRPSFARRLDSATNRLRGKFPKGTGSWGLARKLLNIFLREVLYTTYLSRRYGLRKAERLLELPLDSITGKQLRSHYPQLPRWPGVKHLKPELNAQYQEAARLHGAAIGVERVHLDAIWWGQRLN